MTQLAFGPPVEIPEHRVRALAAVMAGFAFPGRGSFEKLTVEQKRVTLMAARIALETLAAEREGG